MLDLTADQQAALASGEPVHCLVSNVAYDDSEWTPAEMVALAERAFDDADTAGPIE